MDLRNMTRRELFHASALTAAAGVLAACQPKVMEVEKVITQVVKETVVVTEEKVVKEAVEVEKEVTRIVEKQAEAAPRQPATIVVMYGRNEFTEAEQAIFEEKYPPYKVEFLDIDLTKLMAMMAAGNPVDFFRARGVDTPSNVTRRIAKDLTDFFETSTKVPVNDLLPVNDIFRYQGRRYGMVKDWSPDFSIFVNKRLFGEAGVDIPSDEEPTPYQTWRELSPKLTKKEGDRILVFGTDFEPNVNALVHISNTLAQPRHLFTDDFSRINLLGDPEVYEAAKFWQEWMKEGGLPSEITPTPSGSWSGQDWVQGQAAAVQWGYWFSGMAVSDAVAGEDVMMLPGPKWGPTYANPCAGGVGGFMTTTTRVPDATWTFIEWFMSEEPAVTRAKSGWGVPGLRSQLDLMPREEPWRQQVLKTVQWELANSKVSVVTWNPFITTATFQTAWSKYRKPYLDGSITLDDMLQGIEQEVNEAIEEGMDRAGL